MSIEIVARIDGEIAGFEIDAPGADLGRATMMVVMVVALMIMDVIGIVMTDAFGAVVMTIVVLGMIMAMVGIFVMVGKRGRGNRHCERRGCGKNEGTGRHEKLLKVFRCRTVRDAHVMGALLNYSSAVPQAAQHDQRMTSLGGAERNG
jgi:hypothetical protein